MALFFPSLEEINSFRVPLTSGESHLVEFLKYLDDNYEIYVQPFLNGDRPDFVIVRPNSGALIIEVKDWQLEHYENSKGGTSSWTLCKNKATIRSPLAQVKAYKENLYDLHVDLLFERNIQDSKNFAVVQTAVYFHKETTENAQKFCVDSKYISILGHDSLDVQKFDTLLKKIRLDRQSILFDKSLYQSFNRFLKPPEHTPDMGKDIKYTTRQQELVKSQSKARQKVRGVAGCGKTKVLAGRAVSAYARTGERVLILTFNITLRNYIRDRISEVRANFPWPAFQITSYHQFFKTQANNCELECDSLDVFDQVDFFAGKTKDSHRYKTILIDEVQDYKEEWLRLLTNDFLAEDGEFVVFGDEKQNVYGREMGNDRFPKIPGVPGQWNQLKESFRMGTSTLRIAQSFQNFYFKDRYEIDKDITIMNQLNLFEKPGEIRYHFKPQINSKDTYHLIRSEILSLNIHPDDLVILAPTYGTIRNLEYNFRKIAHEKTTHICETEEEYDVLLEKHKLQDHQYPDKDTQSKQRNIESMERDRDNIRHGRKLYFQPHHGTVKFSTIHSFKGWEAHTLILVISNTDGVEKKELMNELIYTALTRASKNLIVIDPSGLYQEFFTPLLEKATTSSTKCKDNNNEIDNIPF